MKKSTDGNLHPPPPPLRPQVGIIAANQCRYIFWQRSSIEYLFVKEPYLATVMSTMIARDITNKLYCMNHKVAWPRVAALAGTLLGI